MEQTTYFCKTSGKNTPLHRPTMTYTEVDSSMIDLVGYDAKEQILEVRFINSGLTYRYFDVPKAEYEGLLEASSKGSYMHGNIIDCYDFVKVKGGKRRSW